jgi:beta-galactosidase
MLFLSMPRSLSFLASVLFAAAMTSTSCGQTTSPLYVDATVTSPPGPTSFQGGTSASPDGRVLGMNDRFLTLDGKPWLPVMGEFHYTRFPDAQWEEEILKMKEGGVSIVATYVIWIHHEEVEGQFDWSGQRNLRRFIELCAKHGMLVYPRIGPWAHGEARNGGFPDWLLQKTSNTRQNDPVYLSYVQKYYAQVGQQLKGLLWKDGGPVIGLQLENEYAARGPNAGEAHIVQLKQMAIGAGIDAPFYSVTGWDNAVVPHGQTIAVFGGYPDQPWLASLENLPPQEVYVFRLHSRVTGNMGMMGAMSDPSLAAKQYDFPFITAEMGGGVEDTYNRRPIIQPDDVAAMAPVMLGSGVNLYGSYMFQGGENPDGKLTTLQESQATKYPTDVPVKSYDFQAPLGEFGQEREVFRKLKVFNYFMQEFGPSLAPMETHAPTALPSGPEDLNVVRIMVRSKADSGFLFFNNYVRGTSMPKREGFQVQIKLPSGTLALPAHPVDLPSGSYGIWPFDMQVGPLLLRYATAQPFTRLQNGKGTTYFFVATSGVPTEFAWDGNDSVQLHAASGTVATQQGVITVSGIKPSLTPAITLEQPDGVDTNIVLLNQEQAEIAWKMGTLDREHLILTDAQMYADEQHIILNQDGNNQFSFQVTPRAHEKLNGGVHLIERAEPSADGYSATVPAVHPTLHFTESAKAGEVPPARLGPPASWKKAVAVAPSDSDFDHAAKWNITIPPADWVGVDDLFLDVKYKGDVARLKSASKLLTDDFYNGNSWQIGLRRFRQEIDKGGLELQILPMRKDAPIFIEDKFRISPGEGQIVDLTNLTLVPQYQLTIDRGPSH